MLGGSSRFPDAALGGVRKAALYADTIYVPDPLLPWIEIDRVEERFRHMELLLAYQTLLQLKPLVDAQLSYPAVIVFPSWEKSLETCDTVTQDGIAKLTLEVILKMGTLRRTERCGSHGPNGCTVGGG